VRLIVEHFLRDERSHIVEHGLVLTFVALATVLALLVDPLGIKTSIVSAFGRASHALDAR
jgi:Flp pilus assembly pilin Flp